MTDKCNFCNKYKCICTIDSLKKDILTMQHRKAIRDQEELKRLKYQEALRLESQKKTIRNKRRY